MIDIALTQLDNTLSYIPFHLKKSLMAWSLKKNPHQRTKKKKKHFYVVLVRFSTGLLNTKKSHWTINRDSPRNTKKDKKKKKEHKTRWKKFKKYDTRNKYSCSQMHVPLKQHQQLQKGIMFSTPFKRGKICFHLLIWK